MYALTCPSCSHVVKSPFVRIGAGVVCPQCSNHYVVSSEDVKRRTPPSLSAALSAAVPQPGSDEAGSDLAHAHEPDSPIGLSGLSEMMRHEPQSASTATPVARPIAQASTPKSGRTHSQRRRRVRLILMGLMVIAVGVLGFGFWYATSARFRQPPRTVPTHPPKRMKLFAQPLDIYPWVIVNTRYVKDTQTPGIPLTTTLARLEVQSDGQGQVALTLRYDGEGIVTHAQVQLSLVNGEGIERCRTTANVGFIQAGQSISLRVDVPPALWPREPQVMVQVLNHRAMFDPIMLEDTMVQPLTQLDAASLRITWPHKVANVLGEISFHLTAQGQNPEQHTAYLVHLIDPQTAQVYIEGSPQVSFDVEVPTPPPWDVAAWRVQAAAQ